MTDTLDADIGSIFSDLDTGIVETQPEPTPEPAPAQELAPEPVAQPEQQAALPDEVVQEQPKTDDTEKGIHHVPLTVLLDERDKAKKAKEHAQQLEARLRVYEAQQAAPIPDPYENPQGYQDYMQNQINQQEFKLRSEMSGRFAEQKFGKDTVEAAIAWAQEHAAVDPFLGQRVQMSPSPVEFVVEQYQREQFFKQHSSDLGGVTQAAGFPAAPTPTPVQQAPKPQAPSRSLAAAPNAGGGHQTIPDGSVLDSIAFNLPS